MPGFETYVNGIPAEIAGRLLDEPIPRDENHGKEGRDVATV